MVVEALPYSYRGFWNYGLCRVVRSGAAAELGVGVANGRWGQHRALHLAASVNGKDER
jgi:hypothetical protein